MIRPLLIRFLRGATVLVAAGFLVVYVLHASGRLNLLAADEPEPAPAPGPSTHVMPSSKVFTPRLFGTRPVEAGPTVPDPALWSTSKSGVIRDTAGSIFLRRLLAPDEGETVMVSSKVAVVRPLPKPPQARPAQSGSLSLDRPMDMNLLRLPAVAPRTMGGSKSGVIHIPLPPVLPPEDP